MIKPNNTCYKACYNARGNNRKAHSQGRLLTGFTLIELLVVLAIIGALLSIAAPRYTHSVDKANLAVLQQNLFALRDSIDKMHGDSGKYPQSLDDLVTNKYLRRVPLDPFTGSSASWVLEQSADPNNPGVIDVHSGALGKTAQGQFYKDL